MTTYPGATRGWSRIRLGAIVAACCVAGFTPHILQARQDDDRPKRAEVFVYPKKLHATDMLCDGENAKFIKITSETTLIWADLAPDARYAHDTEYILVSAEGTRVVKGQGWPCLNGKDLFRDGKDYKVDLPMKLSGK